MIEEQQQIIVVTGVQGAGKSTIGRKLAESFKRGVFIEADALHRMIVSGGVWATDEGGAGVVVGESARQLRLRLKNACLLARSFVEAGFTAVIDDIIIGLRWDQLRSGLAGVPFRFVVLAPDVPTVEARDAARESHTIGGGWAAYLDGEMRRTMAGIGLWIDSSEQTADETVEEILRRLPNEGLIES